MSLDRLPQESPLILPEADRNRVLVEWNLTFRDFAQDSCVHELFEAQVRRNPEAVAVVFQGQVLSFAALNGRANRLARHLRQLGIGPDTPVGICADRSFELMVGLLAVLKAGGAFVPLDPEYPDERLSYMLRDCAAPVVLTTTTLASRVPRCEAELVAIDGIEPALAGLSNENLPRLATPENLAYTLYTSGSTGLPKGVLIPHRGICNHMQWVRETLDLGPNDRLLQFTSISFDAAMLELLAPLNCGARLILADPGGHRDPAYLIRAVRDHGITVFQLVPSLLRVLLGMPAFRTCTTLRHMISGGEALTWELAREFKQQLPGTILRNCYGPTEASVDATSLLVDEELLGRVDFSGVVPIGRPIANATAYVLDGDLNAVAVGERGELCIGGAGLAKGYLNRADLTAERFVANPFSPGQRLYRTGDVVRYREDGVLEFFGRVDHQIKIRGYRVELGEIESVIGEDPDVRECVVLAREDRPGVQRLVAYVVGQSREPDLGALRHRLRVRVAEYMVPSAFVVLNAMPTLPNGKLDRHALPRPGSDRPELDTPYAAPEGEDELLCCEVFAATLDLDRVGRDDNFFELGGNSLLAMQVLDGIAQRCGRTLSAATIFAHPTPATLARDLGANTNRAVESLPVPSGGRRAEEPIALIGMAGRFPGAETIESFWNNLLEGRDSITQFTDATLDPSIPPSVRADSSYVRARGVIEQVEQFDAAFFGIPAREAEVMDPQHRVFLEVAWECLERAGYAPDRTERSVGVFAGVDTPTYLMHNVLGRPDVVSSVGELLVALGNDKDYVATRVANRFNLRGPAIAVNTACSTSLVAVAQAVDSLRAGRCEMALAGGASVHAPPASGYMYVEGSMLSPDGQTRTFDADAKGTAFNDGAAAVLLKPLSLALADGDQIYGLIRGVGINNDGGGKASFTAPSVDGQEAVIAAAHEESGIDPATISYIEAHGTATPLGDPVEVEALTRAFRRRTGKTGFCRIGSVKSNVGHLVTAAGATGLIKTALALTNETLPPTIHFKAANPRIPFADSPFVVCDRLVAWPRSAEPRRAGVSSFGVGGTNAHVVIEEAPLQLPTPAAQGPQLLRLAARSQTALDSMAARLADHLESNPRLNLADVAHTLHVGRSPFAHRLCVAAAAIGDAVAALREKDSVWRTTRSLPTRRPGMVMLFPGQGAQYAAMGRGLYESENVFRDAFDACCAAMSGTLDFDLRQRVFKGGADALTATGTTQPATFALEYSLARLWLARGLQPVALIGHSVGEFVAAVLAEVMSLADACRLVARRGALMQALPAGSMLSVRLPASTLESRLPADLSLAAENGPNACVVAGPTGAIEAFSSLLESEGVVTRRLVTSHAFHSSMMDPAVEPFEAELREVALSAPRIPIVSTVTGTWMTAEQATDPSYWSTHLREPVRFSPAIETALARDGVAFVEAGPRATLSMLVRQHGKAGADPIAAVASLGDSPDTEARHFALALGQMWTLGIDLPSPDSGTRRRVVLPTYPFERKRVWLDIAPSVAAQTPVASPALALSLPTPEPALSSLESPNVPITPAQSRRPRLVARLASLFEDVSGLDLAQADASTAFIELGLDSLTLTQAAQQVKKVFAVNVTFRQLMETYRSIDALAEFLDGTLPPDPVNAPAAPPVVAAATQTSATPIPGLMAAPLTMDTQQGNLLHQLIAQQMQLMGQQLALLTGQVGAIPMALPALTAQPPVPTAVSAGAPPAQAAATADEPVAPLRYDAKKAFGAIARIHTKDPGAMTDRQKAHLAEFIGRYAARTSASKAYTERHRQHMADPRVVNGFRPQTKEMVYQIVIERSLGSRMWDLDGNEYVDALGGFGMCMFGWQPDFVQEAVKRQLDCGYDIGPMHPLAGEVCDLVCELTGCDRAALVNTGSEAVMGAIRIARTSTARNKIVTFTGSYHGTFDEVLVRAGRNHKGIPAAPGIMPGMFGDIIVVDYGSPEALETIRQHADDIAAVLVEPVQSRRPEYQPREFLHELRKLTAEEGICLVFDEVITGFRARLGGAQEFFDVRADLCTYGKVIGGGMPIGVIAGKRDYMDALDGGSWQFGDDSMPTVGVTYLAGTFVRHPLALAAAKASLEHLKAQGPALQERLNLRIAAMADELNAHCREVGAPVEIRSFASLWRTTFLEDHPWQDLLFAMMRSRGVHILDNFPCYGTTALNDDDIATIKRAFKESIAELQEAEFMPRRPVAAIARRFDESRPPIPGAKLGRDESGNPAWFVPHPEKAGKYLKVDA